MVVSESTSAYEPPSASTRIPSELAAVLRLPDDSLGKCDIGLLNLLCTSGLQGAGTLEVDRYVAWLDESARKVKEATEENNEKFLHAPAAFENSYARFCMISLVTVLQRRCGVKYNPKWKDLTPDRATPDNFGADARDVFIHAIIDGIGGTCGSLPVLYAAIGHRLGYPLKIVKATQHLFLRWDDADGKHGWAHPDRFNIEATGPGVHFLPDAHYRTWPHKISDEDIAAGVFLRSLSRNEELAEFMATRGYCLRSNNRLLEAVDALAEAARLAPNNRHIVASHQSLRLHIMMRRRGHAFLNATVPGVPGMEDLPEGPFWVDGLGGQRVLVQAPRDVFEPPSLALELGHMFQRERVQLPDGRQGDVYVPHQGSYPRMTAYWLRQHNGRYLLIHRPVIPGWPDYGENSPRGSWPGHTCGASHRSVFARHHAANHWGNNPNPAEIPELAPHEQNYLLGRIDMAVEARREEESTRGLPSFSPLAIPPGPAAPRLKGSFGSPPSIV